MVCSSSGGGWDYLHIAQFDATAYITFAKSVHHFKRTARKPGMLSETNPLILNDVIEDELLLALPQIPMHAEAQCPASKWLKQQHAETADETEENPFSVLANLKQD